MNEIEREVKAVNDILSIARKDHAKINKHSTRNIENILEHSKGSDILVRINGKLQPFEIVNTAKKGMTTSQQAANYYFNKFKNVTQQKLAEAQGISLTTINRNIQEVTQKYEDDPKIEFVEMEKNSI